MDLASLPLFAGADPGEVAELVARLTDEEHAAGDVLMREGEPGTSFAIVVDGEVAFRRAGRVLGTAGPGSVVGELALLTGHPRQATVEAATDVCLAAGDHDAFDVLLEVPGVHDRLADVAARRLAEAAVPVAVVLRDGSRVVVRPLLARDRDKIDVGLEQASPESLRRRFFSPGRPSARTVELLVNINYVDHFAWGVTTDDGAEGVATARYIRLREDRQAAEVAFFIVEPWRARGLATLLLGALAAAASSAGITRFVAEVLTDNSEMKAVLDKASARWDFDEPGVLAARMEVRNAAALLDAPLRNQFESAAHDVVTAAGLALLTP